MNDTSDTDCSLLQRVAHVASSLHVGMGTLYFSSGAVTAVLVTALQSLC